MSKQTENKRKDGKFAKGNKLGNRWKKGESGNPTGRRSPYTELIKELSFKVDKDKNKEQREVIADKLFQLAKYGDLRAIQFIVERLEGKAKETREVTNKNEPIEVMVIND